MAKDIEQIVAKKYRKDDAAKIKYGYNEAVILQQQAFLQCYRDHCLPVVAENKRLREALEGILKTEEPDGYKGCGMCDSGRLRIPGNPVKDHFDDCPYKIANDVLAKSALSHVPVEGEANDESEIMYCNSCKCNTLQVFETTGMRCQKCGTQNPFANISVADFKRYMNDMINLHQWQDVSDIYKHFDLEREKFKKDMNRMFVKAQLPKHYAVHEGKVGNIKCSSETGIDEKEWEIFTNSCREFFKDELLEFYHETNYRHKEFFVYLKRSVEGDDGWIELKEGCKLPDYDVPVLWLNDAGNMHVEELDKDGNPWLFEEIEGLALPKITHYRYLPTPPTH